MDHLLANGTFACPLTTGALKEYAERSEVLLQGRRTYQVSAAAWPERGGDPFSDWINSAQKYVVSDTLSEADLTAQTASTGVQICRYRPRR